VTVIVENKPGAGGQLAAQALKAAAPDGTTFFLSHDHSISILPLVTRNAGFDPATDFIPVAGFASFANVLAISGGRPALTSQEYVAWVQSARGGKGKHRRARARLDPRIPGGPGRQPLPLGPAGRAGSG
jgi:tripartite-type tricarboxylate transporter receptor subunit TctC